MKSFHGQSGQGGRLLRLRRVKRGLVSNPLGVNSMGYLLLASKLLLLPKAIADGGLVLLKSPKVADGGACPNGHRGLSSRKAGISEESARGDVCSSVMRLQQNAMLLDVVTGESLIPVKAWH